MAYAQDSFHFGETKNCGNTWDKAQPGWKENVETPYKEFLYKVFREYTSH